MTTDLILGTAGHIDHGKTSLIRALTGVDTDRLPEEQQRGITIELGFAQLDLGDYRLGVVDVPGHERFVRNMLAGATGMDVAMLVVAADDSIKPQTREHLDVLRLLDLPAGVIALTKCDLADPDWMDLVEDEIRELVRDTFLAQAPIVRTSSTTGEGLDQLRSALTTAAQQANTEERIAKKNAPFRMPIDRSFTVVGYGTVVTGSVASGRVSVGDRLVIQPGDIEVRVRGLHNHDQGVDEVHAGQRAAVNLAGVRHDDIRRGHELAAAGHLVPSQMLTVQLTVLPDSPWPLKSRSRIRVHVGTAELMASVSLLDAAPLKPGQSGWAQLFLSEPAVTSWNQPLVIRNQSPVVTIGGGHVLVSNATRIRKPSPQDFQQLEGLTSGEPLKRAGAALYFAATRDWRPEELGPQAGIHAIADVHRQLIEAGQLVEIVVSPRRTLRVHRVVLDQLCDRIESVLTVRHDREPLRSLLDRARVVNRMKYLADETLINAMLGQMQANGRIRMTDRGIGLAGRGPRLSANERKLFDQLVQQFRDARFQPPTVKQCKEQATKNRDAVQSLIDLAVVEQQMVQVNSDLFLHADVEQEMRRMLAERMTTNQGLTMSEIREVLDTSRKYAVPFCEYLDKAGFTRRQGDVRFLANDKCKMQNDK